MSQGQKVLVEIKLIRAALAEQGNRLQKLPRQAVWIIHHTSGSSYRLTYQPAPLSAWSLHPPSFEASQLLGDIDRALNRTPLSSSDEAPTQYHQQLHPWCIIQLLPQMQRRTVARFRRRNDAEAHMRVLKQQNLATEYTIVFDPALDPLSVAAKKL